MGVIDLLILIFTFTTTLEYERVQVQHEVIEDAIVYSYNAEEGQTDDSPTITASGEEVHEGGIANNCLPFGSKVVIDGEVYTVNDRMNKRYGCNVFDIFLFDKKESLKWGKKTKDVILLK